jgi:DNA ligase-1
MKPEVWFEPSAVWEVMAADFSVSPVHTGAIGHVHDSKGIGLRFPRFIRIRDDKNPEQATTAEQVSQMFRNQKITHTAQGDDD